jgi:hypothetical protein
VPSATDALKKAKVTSPAENSTGGTDDMKKSLSKSAEETQMPMVGHGNNHSVPDGYTAETAKQKR